MDQDAGALRCTFSVGWLRIGRWSVTDGGDIVTALVESLRDADSRRFITIPTAGTHPTMTSDPHSDDFASRPRSLDSLAPAH
jgi:hypothetical protein